MPTHNKVLRGKEEHEIISCVYLFRYNMILVAHPSDKTCVVLDPGTGSVLQSMKLPGHVRDISFLCAYDDQIIAGGKDSVSYFLSNNCNRSFHPILKCLRNKEYVIVFWLLIKIAVSRITHLF